MKISRGKIKWLVFLAVLCGLGAGYYWGYYLPRLREQQRIQAERDASEDGDLDRTFRVRRDNLVIGLLQGGYVNASQKHKLSLQATLKTRTKLLWVIDENATVKAGDLLASFDTEDLKESIDNQEIELDNLRKELELAIESEKIQLSSNEADLQSAEENVLQANDALQKYRRFERTSQRDSLELAVTNAEANLSEAEASYASVRDSEFSDSDGEKAEDKKAAQLKTEQAKIDDKENALKKAEDNLRVFRRYDHPSKLTRLMNALEQAKLNQKKTRISAESKIVQSKKTINNLERRIKRVSDQLARDNEFMGMMELRAPVDGVVIYGDPDRRWGNVDVKTGIEVNKGQVLITIPEMSNLIVEFDLPEQYRSKVAVGDVATITPDSLPGERFTGKISKIDTLPVPLISWDASSPKVYKSRIAFDEQSEKLVNGMSVQINIVTKTIPDTLFVPVEAVFEDNDRFFVYVSTLTGSKEVTVEIGESNDNFVQITSGLAEGDVVFLYRPYQKNQDYK